MIESRSVSYKWWFRITQKHLNKEKEEPRKTKKERGRGAMDGSCLIMRRLVGTMIVLFIILSNVTEANGYGRASSKLHVSPPPMAYAYPPSLPPPVQYINDLHHRRCYKDCVRNEECLKRGSLQKQMACCTICMLECSEATSP